MLKEQEFEILCRRLKLPKAGRKSLARCRADLDRPAAFSRVPLMLAEPDESRESDTGYVGTVDL